eukprot:gene4190-4603_t
MKKIKPVYEDIAFDSLDTLSGPSSNSSNRRKNGKIIPLSDDTAITAGKVRKKPQGGLAPGKDHVTSYISNKSYRHQILIWNHIKDFTCSMKSLRLGAPFVVLAIIFGGILEMYSLSQRYNFTIILALSAAMKFPNFPSQSVRPQLCLSVVTLLSFAADGYFLATHYLDKRALTVLFCFFLTFKLMVFYAFLHNISAASRVRRLLDRRLRLFGLPCHLPRRIMRDIRGRLLALGWIHLFLFIAYIVLLIVFWVILESYRLSLAPTEESAFLIFLSIKVPTTLLVLLGLLYDSDLRMCLWYFGCMVWCQKTVRDYIEHTVKELGGYPLAFSFFPLRFHIVCIIKSIDVAWGMYGWLLIGWHLAGNKSFAALDQLTQGLLSVLIFLLVLGDIYSVMLFAGVRWLWRRQKAWLIRQKLKRRQESVEEEKSDDSELDDFHLRPAFLQEGEGESNDPRAISLNGFDQTIDKEVEKEGFEGRYAETDPLLGVEHKADDILDEVVVNMMTEKEDKLEVEEVTRSSEVVLSDQTLLQMRKNEEQSLYREEQRRRREEHEDTAALGFDVLDPPRPHNRHQSRPRYRTDRKGPAHVYYRITMDEETSNPLRERKDSRQKGVETKPDAHNSIDSEDSEELPLDGDGSFTYNYRDRRGRSTARVTKFV